MGVGRYEGKAVVELLDNGRQVKLVQPFAYIDSRELRWDVKAGAVVDGASIPRVLWTLIGGPFEGKYRNASIVHDWYCDVRTRPWKKVHLMFYDAMIASGVPKAKARLMYAGVRFGGPRWTKQAIDNSLLATGAGNLLTVASGSSGMWVGGDLGIIPVAGRASGSGANGARLKLVVHKGRDARLKSRSAKKRSTTTVVSKYQMGSNDLDWLVKCVKDPSASLESIDEMIDDHLADRSPRTRTVTHSK